MLKELAEKAFSKPGERSAANFLKKHPELVVWGFCRTGGHAKYVLSEFPFGSQYKADFVIPFAYSGAWDVHLVELEPTDDMVITKKGLPSKRLNGALAQLADWMDFIERDPAVVRGDLSRWCIERDLLDWHRTKKPPFNGTGDRLRDPHTYISWQYHIIIGRRNEISSEKRRRMNQLRTRGRVQIGTYDRFVDIAANYDCKETGPDKSVSLAEHRDRDLYA